VLETNIFLILSLFLLTGAVMVLWSRQTVLSVFGFMIAMLSMAGIFAVLGNSFLFLAQIMIAVGAVVVLSLIVIMTINLRDEALPKEPHKLKWILLAIVLVSPFSVLMYRSLVHLHRSFEQSGEAYGTIQAMGSELFSRWVLPFEIVSVLLLAAMVAAIVIARKESKQ
jgi:NADH-quinone oxidoreductase subunit J